MLYRLNSGMAAGSYQSNCGVLRWCMVVSPPTAPQNFAPMNFAILSIAVSVEESGVELSLQTGALALLLVSSW